MLFHAIDSVLLAAGDLEAACRPYERLGLKVSPPTAGCCSLCVGAFAVHFLHTADDLLGEPLRRALAAGRSLFAVGLAVLDLGGVLATFEKKGLRAARFGEMAWLALEDQAGADLVLVQHSKRTDQLSHSFPLKRLDHLAVVTHDLDEKTRYWADVLGVPLAGEVATPTMVIRQFRFGDAVLELLGPASADSPLWGRTPGLAGMISWEVTDLGESVRLARAAGFTVSEPATGALPNTRIATIQGNELAGVNMQLLQYESERRP